MLKITREHPAIVVRAYLTGVTDIGQLTKGELKDLNKAIKQGLLSKIWDYTFPLRKTCYVMSVPELLEFVKDPTQINFMYDGLDNLSGENYLTCKNLS